MFRHWLQEEISREPKIFYDVESIEVGESWPYQLATGIAASKVLICLWSNEYFSSPWCTAELGHMLARRESTRSSDGPLPLILALVIHDGENIPKHLQDIQRLPIQDFANPWLRPKSPKAEKLSELIRDFSAHVSHALQKAPSDCDPYWSELATDRFIELLERRTMQHEVPSLGRPL
jgi:hypothetical protein